MILRICLLYFFLKSFYKAVYSTQSAIDQAKQLPEKLQNKQPHTIHLTFLIYWVEVIAIGYCWSHC